MVPAEARPGRRRLTEWGVIAVGGEQTLLTKWLSAGDVADSRRWPGADQLLRPIFIPRRTLVAGSPVTVFLGPSWHGLID